MRIASSTRARVSPRTWSLSLMTRETVWFDTPASFATSAITAGRRRSSMFSFVTCTASSELAEGLARLVRRFVPAQLVADRAARRVAVDDHELDARHLGQVLEGLGGE